MMYVFTEKISEVLFILLFFALGHNKLITWSMIYFYNFFLVCAMETITDKGTGVDIIYLYICNERPTFKYIFFNMDGKV